MPCELRKRRVGCKEGRGRRGVGVGRGSGGGERENVHTVCGIKVVTANSHDVAVAHHPAHNSVGVVAAVTAQVPIRSDITPASVRGGTPGEPGVV